MTTILVATLKQDDVSVTVFDASTPEKKAKAITHGIMLSYGAASVNSRHEFPDTPEAHELLGYLDQLVAAKENAWELPAPTDHPCLRYFGPLTCLAEFIAEWIDFELWDTVIDMDTTATAWSYRTRTLEIVPEWDATRYGLQE